MDQGIFLRGLKLPLSGREHAVGGLFLAGKGSCRLYGLNSMRVLGELRKVKC